MGVENIILCSFLMTIICLLPFTGNDTSTDRFISQLKNFVFNKNVRAYIALFV